MSSGSGFNTDSCTLQTCPLSEAKLHYIPSLGGNVFYLVLFGLLAIIQAILGLRYRTWGFMVGMVLGLICEVIGYIARTLMHYNPFLHSTFVTYIVTITIGPAFLTAAIYLCLARLVVVFGSDLSRFRPRTYTYVFITSDIIALLLQAAGGAISASANDQETVDKGVNIMIAGLAWQVFSLAVFAAVALEFAWRCRRAMRAGRHVAVDSFATLVRSRTFMAFIFALGIATLTIFIRSVFRVAELSGGFGGKLANDQVTFMVLEGAMISIATIALTVLHPGIVFKGKWAEASWTFKQGNSEESNMETKVVEQKQTRRFGLFGRRS